MRERQNKMRWAWAEMKGDEDPAHLNLNQFQLITYQHHFWLGRAGAASFNQFETASRQSVAGMVKRAKADKSTEKSKCDVRVQPPERSSTRSHLTGITMLTTSIYLYRISFHAHRDRKEKLRNSEIIAAI
jgi:hypothetical protein